MDRGEVWWAELDGEAGFRPVIIVSRSDKIAIRRNITIAEITSSIRSLPSEVRLSKSDGMPNECVINTESLYTIPKDRLRRQITKLSDTGLFALTNALRYSLELDW